MTPVQLHAERVLAVVRSDRGARWAFRLALVGAAVVYWYVGRNQFFVRDDWASAFTRGMIFHSRGWQHWLLDPQDGHWLAVPVLVFHETIQIFGLESYWPFLIPTLLSHVAAVLLVRVLCLRNSVSAWTTTIVCSMLLVFGSGWENMIFAIQISYNFSLVAFLAQVVLTDHEGPVDRRDYLAAGLTLIGVMSSGFGPIFMIGIIVVLAMRRRWMALLVALVPQGLLYGWWFLTWETDPAAAMHPGNQSQLPAFVASGLSSTFDGLTGLPGLGGIALVGTLIVVLSRRFGPRTQATMLGLAATAFVMFSAIGFERVGFGVRLAGSSRYVHVAAMLVAPAFALAVDQLARLSREARWAGLAVVSTAAALNFSILWERSASWSMATHHEKLIYELVAGSGLGPTANQGRIIFPDSPDVTVGILPFLVDKGVLHPRVPLSALEIQQVKDALGLTVP